MAAAAIAVARAARKPRTKSALRAVPQASAIHSVQEIDNTRVKRVADPREARTVGLYMMIGLLAFAACIGVAYQQFAIIKDGYDIADLKTKRDDLIQDNKRLASQMAALRNPERISNYASASLGLVAPKQGQVVRFETPLPPTEGEPVMARLQPYGGKP
jgi:hypothetical protein